jgi:hypothetical protein
MKAAAITLAVLVVLAHPSVSADTKSGTACVIPISGSQPTIGLPGNFYNPATLTLKIDKQPAILWPHKQMLKVNGFDLTKRHLVLVISDGKPLRSTWFRFNEFAGFRSVDHLCSRTMPIKV